MSSKPNVSILMPTFNEIQHIDAAVLSVLGERYQDWELMICDDASTDSTFERAKFWAEQDDRIRAMRPYSEPGHFVDNCNVMLAEARGMYIARLDADDITLPNRLASQVDFMHRREGSVYVGGLALAIMEEEGGRLSADYPWLKYVVTSVASYTEPVNEFLRTNNPIVHSSVLARREIMQATGGYENMAPSEDWDMALMMATHGEVYVLPELVCLKRQHAANLTRRDKALSEAAFQRLKKKHSLEIERRIQVCKLAAILGGSERSESD